MVILLVNTKYIHTKIYTSVARYLLAGVGRPARVPPRPHDGTGQDMIDSNLNLPDAHVGSARDLESSNWSLNTPCQSGTDCRLSRQAE